ncbi:FAD dependent oxidoreductase superfamily protein [Colletotrichum kahawae]|uniref:FAD dependent oxidoreductase superfamily protein n=1 Tax=Colletotrichum kahawae TaxID=34407 RepID=A0AAE0D5U2_COLKA|nr:FAD dependent oxidoreductase superfamily protein [Colletotrichum kahawae]
MAVFEMSHVQAIKDLVEKEKIDCDFVLTRAYDVILDPKLVEKTKKEFDQLVEEISHGQGRLDAHCAFSFTVGSLWPYKLVTHLLSLAVRGGVNLQTHTPVTSVSDTQDADGYWLVSTLRGVIKAKKVIFATNGYTAGILPEFREKIIPVRGICSRIAVPEGQQAPSLPSSYSVRHNAKGADYQITRPDGSIIVGGGRPAYWHKENEWYDNFDDSKMIQPAVTYFDGLMQRTYRGWEQSDASVDRVWTGILGYTNDLMPYAGAVPSKHGQFVCAGFNGHGMPAILLTAKGIAKMVLEDCTFEKTGVPWPFKVTAARLQNPGNAIRDMLMQAKL